MNILIYLVPLGMLAAVIIITVIQNKRYHSYLRRIGEVELELEDTDKLRNETEKSIESFRQNRSEEALKELFKNCEAYRELYYSEIPTVNILMNIKKHDCVNKGIDFMCESIAVPEDMEAAAIVAIVGNILDNAIEAAGNSGALKPYVKLTTRISKGVWVIEAANSKSAAAAPLKSGFKTSKADKQHHGLGLGIIKRIVSSYKGQISFEDAGDEFKVRVNMICG